MNATETAANAVMQDLIDCLLAEAFFPLPLVPLLSAEQWQAQQPAAPLAFSAGEQRLWDWCYDPAEQRHLCLLLRPGITQAWEKVPGSPVLERQGQRYSVLDPQGFMAKVFGAAGERFAGNEKGLALFQQVLAISVRQTALSLNHGVDHRGLLARSNGDFFQVMEQWASLRDRPYHPLAKAKQGLDDDEYRRYQAEFDPQVRLAWVAVARSQLLCGEGVADLEHCQPADYLLAPEQRASLKDELQRRGLAASHVALPVHPWQLQRVLPAQLGDAFADGSCQVLEFAELQMRPTSSLRSLAPCSNSGHQLKLPMAVYSLGASRYLPAVKMINGGLSEALLRQALERDEVLARTLHLCDEGKWWALMPPEATLFDEAPRHLAAMVRSYPQALLEGADSRLLPMAALGTPLPGEQRHFFDDWLQYRQLAPNASNVTLLFRELCTRFFDVNLRMVRLGMLGEVHGQNAVMVWQAGQMTGVLLRDHDSLRIFVPWLERNGMADPCYRLKPGHSNTLYHERGEDLLFWLQTLAIQVNVRAIIDTLAQVYELPATGLWQCLREVLEERIAAIAFDQPVRALLKRQLFDAPNWPQKLLLTPMIERAGGPGSMPFGKGEVVNPFQRLGAR